MCENIQTDPQTKGNDPALLTIPITIYFIYPNGKLKLLFNKEHISIILNHETHAHTHS